MAQWHDMRWHGNCDKVTSVHAPCNNLVALPCRRLMRCYAVLENRCYAHEDLPITWLKVAFLANLTVTLRWQSRNCVSYSASRLSYNYMHTYVQYHHVHTSTNCKTVRGIKAFSNKALNSKISIARALSSSVCAQLHSLPTMHWLYHLQHVLLVWTHLLPRFKCASLMH